MKKESFICDNCDQEIGYHTVGDNPYKDRDTKKEICDDCYHEKYESTCPICEDYFDIPTKPKDHYFYSNEKESGILPGFYKVLDFPVFRSDGFSGYILEENIKKVSDNLVYKGDRHGSGNLLKETNFICKECFDKKGIDRHRVTTHIRQELTKIVRTDKRLKKHNWIIKVSPEYFKGLETKNKHLWKWTKQVTVKADKNKKIQEVEIIKQK